MGFSSRLVARCRMLCLRLQQNRYAQQTNSIQTDILARYIYKGFQQGLPFLLFLLFGILLALFLCFA